MEGTPRPGDAHWQFHWPGHAPRQGLCVLGSGGPVKVPYRSFSHTLVTQEQSPWSPVCRQEWSVEAGLGYIRERGCQGDKEQIRLVSGTR